jgi:hypothetical protein
MAIASGKSHVMQLALSLSDTQTSDILVLCIVHALHPLNVRLSSGNGVTLFWRSVLNMTATKRYCDSSLPFVFSFLIS